MSVDIDADLRALMSDPATHAGAPVTQIETHAARVFLAGERAYKLKKPVAFGYLDFSDRSKREAALAAELTLNRPNAPDIYRGLIWIRRRADGALSLNGEGAPVEPVLEMNRFDGDALLDAIAVRGALDAALARDLALAVRASHDQAPVRPTDAGAETILSVLHQACSRLEADGAPPSRIEALRAALASRLDAHRALLDRRGRNGFVRRCHGDLHLGNIVRHAGFPVLFDALEFDEGLATIDLIYDLAFLVMDLIHHDLAPQASVLVANYFAEDSEAGAAGAGLLAPFCGLRALIRALVALDRDQPGDAARAETHLALAEALTASSDPRLIAVGGLSGTGKSTLALALAPRIGGPPGALVIRADLERKAMAGVRWNEPLPSSTYTTDWSQRVYARMRAKARAALEAGASVVLDAVHAREEERVLARAVADEAGVSFDGIWLEADVALLRARVGARRGDASDADAAIVEAQTGYDLGRLDWTRIDASGGMQATLAAAFNRISG